MPDTHTPIEQDAHPVDALLPTIRAALIKAYQHGAADSVHALVAAAGMSLPQQPDTPGNARSKRQPYGSFRHVVLDLLARQDVASTDDIAAATGRNMQNTRVHMYKLMQAGIVKRVSSGIYTLATREG